MLGLALSEIYTQVFHLRNSIELDSAWVEDSCQCQFSLFPRVFARLTLRHTRVCGNGIPNDAYLTF